jgi:RecB family exonuclease
MAHLWSELKDQATLKAIDPARLEQMIDAAAAQAVAQVRSERPGRLEGRFAELERDRLAAIAREWLEIERRRAPFEVVLREGDVALSAGNLQLRGRVDRMDRLEGGGLAIIDYKTGSGVSLMSWLGDRPDDAQLPLYALAAAEEDVRAVAFARLKVGKLSFTGLAREADLLPGVKVVDKTEARKHAGDWSALVDHWRRSTTRLGEDFAAGSASVDPKRMLATCERCDLQPLCRVHERLGTLDEGDELEEEFD